MNGISHYVERADLDTAWRVAQADQAAIARKPTVVKIHGTSLSRHLAAQLADFLIREQDVRVVTAAGAIPVHSGTDGPVIGWVFVVIDTNGGQ